ncbi:adhesion G protein-coupled receptor A1 [Tachysurus vachellii]|uniref:adhesion G protein-coupled receptor A1 n=1 Tax=Tachysurus vachellii TaxID=175792 RepID=UPI00296B11A8|nr:adhesion G protein-coupled receptor A1 [Tachysurus vachellii]
MDLKRVLSFPPYPGEYLHPVVYACTAVMLLCLLISIMTYIIHHSVIRISRKGWHILLNVLFHTAMTFGVFAGGINQIKYPIVCQVVGIILHYSSLSTMLWLVLTARNTCNEVSKAPPLSQDRDLPTQPHPKFAIFRFYLFSSGIPIVIVGVTAAVNLDNYGSRDDAPYCWMAWEPSLGGFYGPSSVLVLVMCMYFLCTFVQLKRHPERKYELKAMTEEQQRLATAEIGHCPAASGEPGEQGEHSGCMAITASMLANEHSFKAQLRSTAFTVFLFLATWAFGALAVSQGHYLSMIFSCLYGAFSVTLGLFLLIQHCAKRDDVWHRWWACCPSKPKLDVNGETAGSTESKSHFEGKRPYAGKPLLSPHLLTSSPHCNPSSLPTAQIPMSPCCSTLYSSSIVLEGSAHSLSLPEELPRPSLPLQSCLKDRTKSRSFSRPRPCLRDFTLHMTSSSLDGSVQSSHLDSPHSMHLENPITCHTSHLESRLSCQSPHLDNQLHCTSPSIHMESHRTHLENQLPCHEGHTCHTHMCCAKAEPLSSVCCPKTDTFSGASQGKVTSTACMMHSSTKMTNKEEDIMLHLDIPPPRSTMPSSQATLSRKSTLSRKGTLSHNSSLHEDYVFIPDSTGNIRTGPWKNETTV